MLILLILIRSLRRRPQSFRPSRVQEFKRSDPCDEGISGRGRNLIVPPTPASILDHKCAGQPPGETNGQASFRFRS